MVAGSKKVVYYLIIDSVHCAANMTESGGQIESVVSKLSVD